MTEANQSQEALLQKRLSELLGSVRELALSDLELEDGDDEVSIRAADTDQPGRLIAQFSVAGVKDSYGDIITQDAFGDLNGKNLAMVWSHDRSAIIGKGVVRMEGKKAIWDGQLFINKGVPDADMAYTVIKEMKNLQEYSWGFRIREAKPIKEKGPDGQMYWNGGFEITKLSGIEVSPVLKGAHPKTKTISIKEEGEIAPQNPVDTNSAAAVDAPVVAKTDAVGGVPDVVAEKGMTVAQEFEAALAAVSSFAVRMKALDAKRVEEQGRHLGDENLGRLKELQAELTNVQVQITDVLKAAEAVQGVPVGDRFRFAEIQQRRLELLTMTGEQPMSRIVALQEQAKTLLTQAQEIRDRYKAAETMTQEDANTFDTVMNKYDDIMSDLAREQKAANIEKALNTPVGEIVMPTPADADLTKTGASASKYTVEETMRAYGQYLVRGDRGINPRDMEVIRAYQADNDQEGGYLVAPEQMVAGLLKALDDDVFIRGLSTKYTVTKAESLGVVTLESDVDDPTWTSELATGDEEDGLRLGKRALFPHPLAKRVKLSRKLIRQATVDPANLLITRMTRKFGTTEENVFLNGTGHEQPLGIFTAHADGIPTSRDVITGDVDNFTADAIINAFYTLKGPYRRSAVWVLHRECLREIRKLKYADGTYIWSPGLERGGEPNILGRPYVESEFAPNTFSNGNYAAVLGDFSYYWIVDALDVQFQVLNELYAVTNQIGYIGRKEMDAQPVMGEAFVRLKFATS